MHKKIQTEMTQKTQGKFYRFIEKFREGFTLPEHKAIRDLTRGILTSGSVIVYQSARELQEKTRTKKTAERFYRNLKRPGFDLRIRERLLEMQCRELDSETLILVDGSDLAKPVAKRMEGLKKVWDGSAGKTETGYELLNLIACQPQEQGCRIFPLSSDLVSQTIEPDSLHNLLFDRINEVTIHSGNRGIFVFDRGYDRWRVIDELARNDNAFIIRSCEQRHFEVDGRMMSIRKVRETTPLCYRVQSSKSGWFECGVQRVRVRVSNHPTQDAPMVDLFLVLARYNSHRNKKGGWFSFLCRFPGRNLSDETIIAKTLASYRLRWKIEELHRQVKQDFGWEKVQLLSYTGLKNLNILLWAALAFLYSLQREIVPLALAFTRKIEPGQGPRSVREKFIFYRLYLVVMTIFKDWRKSNWDTNRGRYHDQMQLRVRFV